MNPSLTPSIPITKQRDALTRLIKIAQSNSGQSRYAANFLLAWHNAAENGGWDPTELWAVDAAIAMDMMIVLTLIRDRHNYPDAYGYATDINRIWQLWRGERG